VLVPILLCAVNQDDDVVVCVTLEEDYHTRRED
jgi:hypothetical protein